jgi:hypothetical protein
VSESGEFLASLYSVRRGNEDDCKVAFETDAQQIDEVNKIPVQKAIRIKWEVE